MEEAQETMQVQDAQLRGWLDEAAALRMDVHSLLDGLDRDQLNWQPASTSWSIGQCIQHITLTLRLYPALIDAALRQARAREAAGSKPYREGFLASWFVRSMEPPPRMRVRTSRRVVPPQDLACDVVAAEFDSELTRFADLMLRADGTSLRHARVTSPFLSLLRMTLGQTFAVNLAHARRHVWQARQVRQAGGFPVR